VFAHAGACFAVASCAAVRSGRDAGRRKWLDVDKSAHRRSGKYQKTLCQNFAPAVVSARLIFLKTGAARPFSAPVSLTADLGRAGQIRSRVFLRQSFSSLPSLDSLSVLNQRVNCGLFKPHTPIKPDRSNQPFFN